MNYTAYTANTDGSVNILAGSSNPDVFSKILPAGTQYEVHEGETYTAGGKTYLSDTDPAYIESKADEDKAKKIAALDNQYNADKADLLTAYQAALVYGDSDTMAKLKADLAALDDKYDEDYAKIEGEE